MELLTNCHPAFSFHPSLPVGCASGEPAQLPSDEVPHMHIPQHLELGKRKFQGARTRVAFVGVHLPHSVPYSRPIQVCLMQLLCRGGWDNCMSCSASTSSAELSANGGWRGLCRIPPPLPCARYGRHGTQRTPPLHLPNSAARERRNYPAGASDASMPSQLGLH
ncbi:uncharacterized [Tachysurus ichikawai]